MNMQTSSSAEHLANLLLASEPLMPCAVAAGAVRFCAIAALVLEVRVLVNLQATVMR
jgi:hypothetical protein